MKKTLFLVALILGVLPLFAQSKLSNRSKAIARTVTVDANKAKAFGVRTVDNLATTAVFVRFRSSIDPELIAKYGGTVRATYSDIKTITADMPVASLSQLADEPGIAFVEAANPVHSLMNKARWSGNAQRVIEGASPLTQSYLGTGVIVGVVDEDFQLTHANFWNSDHTRYRIKAFWNQNKQSGSGGFGYSYGKFYTDSASILAAKYDVSMMQSGHATHVTGIAAGANHSVDYYGIAQNADLVLTSTTGDDADLTDGASWIMNYADSLNKPCVINISMGSNIGPHDGTSTCCSILENLVKPGNLIIGAAGNSGDAAMHLQKTFTPTDTVLKSMIYLNYEQWYPYALIDAWGEENGDFEMALVVYNTTKDSIVDITPFFSASADSSFSYSIGSSYSSTKASYDVDVATGVNAINNKPNVYIQFQQNNMPSNTHFGIIIRSDTGTVHVWTEDTYAVFDDYGCSSRGWSAGDGNLSIGEGIGVAKKVVAVGAYCNTSETGTTVGDLSSFSSRGPSADGRLKPEITAPGEGIMSSIPDKVSSYYDSEETTVDGTTYYYASMSGTSMACPYVTGVVATWLEADPTLDYDDLLDIFEQTAKQDSFTGTNLPDNNWGYGKIDGFRGMLYILGLDDPSAAVDNVSDHQIVGIYPNPTAESFSVGFASADENVTLSVVDLSGRTIFSRLLGNVTAGQEFSFSLGDAPEGVYMIKISGSAHTQTYKLVKQ